jgi:hypothetical protein
MNTIRLPVIGSTSHSIGGIMSRINGHVVVADDVVKLLAPLTLAGRIDQRVIESIGVVSNYDETIEVFETKTNSGRTVVRAVWAESDWTEAFIAVHVRGLDGTCQTFSDREDADRYCAAIVELCGGDARLQLAA